MERDFLSASQRRAFERFVRSRMPSDKAYDAADIVQDAYLRALKARPVEELSSQYVWRALRSQIVDEIRKANRTSLRNPVKPLRDPDIIKHPEFWGYLSSCEEIRKQDRELLRGHLLISEDARPVLGSAARKRLSRAKARVTAGLLLKWFHERRYGEVNRYRMPISLMQEVARLERRRDGDLSCFKESFKHPNFSAAMQNATWALRSLAPAHHDVAAFFEQQIRNGCFTVNQQL